MKKHYAFIPIKDNDLSSFRKALISNLWFRPVFGVLALTVLGYFGFHWRTILVASGGCLFFYTLGICFVLYLTFLEVQKVIIAGTLHKSSLLPFIHVSKSDSAFYTEEISNGFIIQTEPVNLVDISNHQQVLEQMLSEYTSSKRLFEYLHSCITSNDEVMINKAIVYIEIIRDQLEKGNKDILATYDRIQNYKEGLR